ncbi:MAG: hypothetical protein R3E86_06530 [Pseudomonadales bacterium]
MNEKKLAQALTDPARVFADPMSVVSEATLTNEQKIEILRRWEYDAKELQVADEEGFAETGRGEVLDEVLSALRELGQGPGTERSPTTKHGGV